MISEKPIVELVGYHRDTKPTRDEYRNGTKLTEVDTGDVYYYDAEMNQWTTTDVILSSIAITTAPTTTSYTAGETLNLAGMVVKATYDNGDVKAVTGYTTSPAAGSTLSAGTTSFTVSFTDCGSTKTATQAITVS